MKRRPTLFRRTAVTVAAGLLVFQLVAALAMFVNLVWPLGQRSADDLATILLLSVHILDELPAERRADYVERLERLHGVIVRQQSPQLVDQQLRYPYLQFLREALQQRLVGRQAIAMAEDGEGRFLVQIGQGAAALRFEFAKYRIAPRPSWALAWIMVAGILATVILASLLARRVSSPVARLADAARRIGRGDRPQWLPETGAAELADLAHVFNETARQLQARRENQSTLLAGISHDLRSPLARMKMALGVLAEQNPSPLLQRLERDVAEMDALIGAQLQLARAQDREAPVATDVDSVLCELLEMVEAHAPGRLQSQLTGLGCAAELAPLALRRCVGNLLENAVRYSGGDVQLVRRRGRSALLIGVRDRGPGIPAELAEAVFRPFYRLESSRNRATGGSGLGLAIVKQLADTQGWRVAVKRRCGGGLSVWLAIECRYT